MRESHGKHGTKIYFVWASMKDRCTNPKSSGYKDYGGRGITVCKRWERFSGFYADMGERPPGASLDRIDNNKGYSKENCRWASEAEQKSNTRRNVWLEYGGKRMTLKQWADELGLNYMTLRSRFRKGWPPNKILTQQIFHNKAMHARLIEFNGVTLSANQWRMRLNIPKTTFYRGLRKGWSIHQIVSHSSEIRHS